MCFFCLFLVLVGSSGVLVSSFPYTPVLYLFCFCFLSSGFFLLDFGPCQIFQLHPLSCYSCSVLPVEICCCDKQLLDSVLFHVSEKLVKIAGNKRVWRIMFHAVRSLH